MQGPRHLGGRGFSGIRQRLLKHGAQLDTSEPALEEAPFYNALSSGYFDEKVGGRPLNETAVAGLLFRIPVEDSIELPAS